MNRRHLTTSELDMLLQADVPSGATQCSHPIANGSKTSHDEDDFAETYAKSDRSAQNACLAAMKAAAMDHPDPCEAALSLVMSNLIMISNYAAAVLEDNAVSRSTSLETFKAVLPAIDAQLRAAREVEKHAQLFTRMDKARTKKW